MSSALLFQWILIHYNEKAEPSRTNFTYQHSTLLFIRRTYVYGTKQFVLHLT